MHFITSVVMGWDEWSSLPIRCPAKIIKTKSHSDHDTGAIRMGGFHVHSIHLIIDDFRGACAVKGNVQVAGRTSSVSTTEMLSTHDVTLRNVDGSLFHVQI